MKKIFLLLLVTFLSLSCSDDDSHSNPASETDKLPPATQIGANTIGCLLNGKAFLPDNLPNSTNCFYQVVEGEYYFYISTQKQIDNNLITIVIKTEKKQIFQNETYNLFENIAGNASGNYLFNLDFHSTSYIHTGKLMITKLDEINHIVSGTFWFDVQDTKGVVHQIREGRFDFQYTN